jgi:hypothetical protein
MQDGTFSDHGRSRFIGSAIFVFIESTAPTFNAFQNNTIQLVPAGVVSQVTQLSKIQGQTSEQGGQSQNNTHFRESLEALEDAKAAKAARAVKKPDKNTCKYFYCKKKITI